jgi:hypothetical protein
MDLRDIGFPGWFRDPACRLGIAFPGVKLAWRDVLASAELDRSGSFAEQLLNNRSFKLWSKPSAFDGKILSFWPCLNTQLFFIINMK